jgi:hypothetical protein
MKTLKALAATIVLSSATLAGSAMADTSHIKGTDNTISTKICVSAAKGKLMKFTQAVSESRLSMTKVANVVSCNGLDIASFAQEQGADKVAIKIRNYQKAPQQYLAKI